MGRQELIALAESLGLEFKKNMASKKLLEMIAEKMNETIVGKEPSKGAVYCGKSPITGEDVWK